MSFLAICFADSLTLTAGFSRRKNAFCAEGGTFRGPSRSARRAASHS